MKQKWIAILLSAALILTLGAACGKKDEPNKDAENSNGNGSINGNTEQNGGTAVPDSPNNDTGMDNNPSSNPAPDANNGMNGSDMNGSAPGNYPTFPDALTTANADVALDDLIDTLGLSERDLQTAMANMESIGGDVTGKTYRHKVFGHDADVSYSFNDARDINRITVRTAKEHADTWRSQLKDLLGATAIEGQTDSWDYSDSTVKMTEDGDHFIITIEKPQM